MPYTYQDYLKETGGTTETPNTYKYSDYLAEQEADAPIREWLKTQTLKNPNPEITPEIRARFEKRKTANPDLQPTEEWIEPTTADKIKGVLANTLGSSGSQVFKFTGDVYDKLNRLSQPFLPPQPNKRITEFSLGDPETGSTGKIETKTVSPKNILELAAETQHQTSQNIGEGGFDPGSLPDTIVRGLTDAATMGVEMGAMGSAGVPSKLIFPVHSSVSSISESAKRGEGIGKQTIEGIKGSATGYVLDKVLHYIPENSKNLIKDYALNIAALTAIPEVKNAIDRIERGENPLDIDWESMFKGIGVSAFLPLIFGVGGGGMPNKKQRQEIKAKDRDAQWRIEQQNIQEADVKSKFDKLPQEMTAKEKISELAELQKKAKEEFGEKQDVPIGPTVPSATSTAGVKKPTIERTGRKEIVEPGASSQDILEKKPSENVSEPERDIKHGGVDTKVGIEVLNRTRETTIVFDKNGKPISGSSSSEGDLQAGGKPLAENERRFKLNPQDGFVYDVSGKKPIRETDPEILKAFEDAGGRIQYQEQPEVVISESELPSAEERAALGIKDVPSSNRASPPPPPIPQEPATPAEALNKHAVSTANHAIEIRNNTSELTELMGEEATHQKMNLAEQSRMAAELPPDVARKVAMGEMNPPNVVGSDSHPLKAEAVWVAEKNRAIANGDAKYLMELAINSPVQEQISQAGKSLLLLRGHNATDPVYQIMEIHREAKETVNKNLGNKKVAAATDRRVKQLEKIILEKTQKIETLENAKTLDVIKYEVRKTGRARAREELKTEFDDLIKQFNKIATGAQMGSGPDVALIARMAKNRIEYGAKTMAQIVDDIYMALGKNIDKKFIRDAVVSSNLRGVREKRELTPEEKAEKYINKRGEIVTDKLAERDFSVKPKKNGILNSRLQAEKDNVDRLAKTLNSLKRISQLREVGVTENEAKKIIELSKAAMDKKNAVKDWNDRSVDGAAREYGRSLYDFHEYTNTIKQEARKLTRPEILSEIRHQFGKSLWRGAKTVSGTSKSILSSMDNSALGRQGIKTLWTHPTVWARNAKQSFSDAWKEMGNKDAMREVMAEILSRPLAIDGTFGKMKLDVGNIEEAYPARGLEKMPYIRRPYKASESAFTGFQYRNRADLAEIYYKLAKEKGVDISNTKEGNTQLEGIGRLVNSLTGRGYLGKSGERSAEALNRVFFAPKFLKSNYDFLFAHRGQGESDFVTRQASINLLKATMATASALAVAKAMGADVELDPRSSDFLKIKVGKTRFDITGGVGSVATFMTRAVGGLLGGVSSLVGGPEIKPFKSSTTGKTSSLITKSGFSYDLLDVMVDFTVGKLSPGGSIIKSIGTGVDTNRKPITPLGMLIDHALPIGWQNIIRNMPIKDKKVWVAAMLGDAFGIGSSTYGNEKPKRAKWKKI